MKLKLLAAFLLMALCSQIVVTHAQATNPTPQPEQGVIQQWSQEILFPAAIRFRVTIALPPAQVSAATLTIKPETRTSVNVPIDLASSIIVGGEITELAYNWQIPADNPPLLFKDITFDWQITSQSGESANIEDKFTFADERTHWLQDYAVSSNLKLTLPDGKPATSTVTPTYTRTGLDNLTTNLKQVTDLLSTNVGSLPNFNLLIYDIAQFPLCSKNAKGETVVTSADGGVEVTCTPTTADQIFAASGYTALKLNASKLGDIQSAVSDYIVTQAYSQNWSGKTIPEWFKSGITDFYSPDSKFELGAPILSAARTNALLPINVMAQPPTTNTDFWRAESYGLVVYIASQVGVDGLFKLAKNAGTADSFDSAYQTALGKPISTLLDNFRRWLFTDAALSAFTFTPYQAATPSPTPSRTPTLTQTPTTTPSATFTPTATVTGVLSPTPQSTFTPTWTASPAPATNTPRPAGSLSTPTPVPVQTPIGNTSRLNAGIIVLVVGVIIVAIAALILFRPRR